MKAHSVIQPKRPTSPDWVEVANPKAKDLDALGFPHAINFTRIKP